ncbi:MAG: DNA adenine methylase [Sphaerochaeta sp.]
MNLYASPLRYPGGKARVSCFVEQLMSCNGMHGGIYAEPYAGGAGVALEMLFSGSAQEIYLNDMDVNIYAFWYAVVHDTQNLISMIEDVEVTFEEWQRQGERFRSPESDLSLTERGFATFFLNRCNRSGILRAGPIGGKKQAGPWKLDARFNKEKLIARILRISAFRDHIHLSRLDALVFLDAFEDIAKQPETLLYLDPPYYRKGSALYQNYYQSSDHLALSTYLNTKYADKKWMISYDKCKAISDLYEGLRGSSWELNYSASSTPGKGTELIFFSPSLVVPSSCKLIVQHDAKKHLNAKL